MRRDPCGRCPFGEGEHYARGTAGKGEGSIMRCAKCGGEWHDPGTRAENERLVREAEAYARRLAPPPNGIDPDDVVVTFGDIVCSGPIDVDYHTVHEDGRIEVVSVLCKCGEPLTEGHECVFW